MKQLEVLPLDGILVHHRLPQLQHFVGSPWHFTSIHLISRRPSQKPRLPDPESNTMTWACTCSKDSSRGSFSGGQGLLMEGISPFENPWGLTMKKEHEIDWNTKLGVCQYMGSYFERSVIWRMVVCTIGGLSLGNFYSSTTQSLPPPHILLHYMIDVGLCTLS